MQDEVKPRRNAFLADGGEMGALTRAYDWRNTSLGPPETWPQSLQTSVRLLLSSPLPMFIWWGPDLIQFYNDAYRQTMGPERHPSALGQPGRECWEQIWPRIGPQIEHVMSGQGSTWNENQLVPVTRHGRREDVWWTYGFSPIDSDGAVGGVLVVCKDVADQPLLTGQPPAFARSQQVGPIAVDPALHTMYAVLARAAGPTVSLALELNANYLALADATQLEASLLNLAIHARDAMPDGGLLKIVTRDREMRNEPDLADGDYIEIAVTGVGTGMTDDVLSRALDPFFPTCDIGPGTGPGLRQVDGVARRAGGTVRVESTVGVGTTVRLLLPRSDGDRDAASDPDEAMAATLRILIIDDDPELREFLESSLRDLGHHTVAVTDGEIALTLLDDGFELLVVDHAMPRINGAMLVGIAREQHPDLPVLFVTGDADLAVIDAIERSAVLRKPFRLSALADAVAALGPV